MRLLGLLIGTMILVLAMAWYLNKEFTPSNSNSISTVESGKQQLDTVQHKVDEYNQSLQNMDK